MRERVWLVALLVGSITGCSTVCDELADEAEANGCALSDGEVGEEEEVDCDEGTAPAAQALCFLDNTSNVCDVTEEEAALIATCLQE